MKVKVNKKELRECIENAVIRALNEYSNALLTENNDFDDILDKFFASERKKGVKGHESVQRVVRTADNGGKVEGEFGKGHKAAEQVDGENDQDKC